MNKHRRPRTLLIACALAVAALLPSCKNWEDPATQARAAAVGNILLNIGQAKGWISPQDAQFFRDAGEIILEAPKSQPAPALDIKPGKAPIPQIQPLAYDRPRSRVVPVSAFCFRATYPTGPPV